MSGREKGELHCLITVFLWKRKAKDITCLNLSRVQEISAVKMLIIHPFAYGGFLKQEFSIFSSMFYFFVKLLPFQSGSKWIIFKTVINLKGEEGWLYSPAMHSKHWEMWRIWQGFCSPFFFTREECPGMSTLSEHFQRRDIICALPISHKLFSSHLRAFGWLRLTNSFSACMGCCVASQMVMKI